MKIKTVDAYVIKYRNHPNHTGSDAYLGHDFRNGFNVVFRPSLESAALMPLHRAIDESLLHPVMDDAHLVAQVVAVKFEHHETHLAESFVAY